MSLPLGPSCGQLRHNGLHSLVYRPLDGSEGPRKKATHFPRDSLAVPRLPLSVARGAGDAESQSLQSEEEAEGSEEAEVGEHGGSVVELRLAVVRPSNRGLDR